MYANIIVNINNTGVDKIFDYNIPDNLKYRIKKGMRVIVPFGKNNKKIEGYVIGISQYTNINKDKLKDIIEVCDDFSIFSDEMIELAFWLKEKYYTTLSNCLNVIKPSGISLKVFFIVFLNSFNFEDISFTEIEKNIINFILERNNFCYKNDIENFFGKNIDKTLKLLKSKNIISIVQDTKAFNFEKKIKYIKLNDINCFSDLYINISNNKKFLKQKEVIDFLLSFNNEITEKYLKEKINISDYTIKTLEKKGLLKIYYKVEKRDVFNINNINKTYEPKYTKEQLFAINEIEKRRNLMQKKRPMLLFGVTGSGKTEIYMNIINNVINEGKEAIMLIPEISLTNQIVEKFVSRFGNKVSFNHSRMSVGERFDQWKKAKYGEISIMIGPRSTLFTPFNNLGIIIIDEEHENSYKSEINPKYDTIETAEKLCNITNSFLLLGSATPDICTYYKTTIGKYDIVRLNNRVNNFSMPKTFIKDMRLELESGNNSIFSKDLYNEIKKNIENKEQTILFLNRRGFSTFVSCRKCGYVMMCNNCNVSYTYHSSINKLVCHYCNEVIENPKVCPNCNSKYIKYFGIGTQKIESEVRNYFPDANILRMDIDTTNKKNSYINILKSFEKGEADILIGTQMIAKGHDFSNVTLVGIISADVSLNTGSYKSFENTFQLITQVSGRAGRSNKDSRVYIQTYSPENYSIKYASEYNYVGFYEEEISIRNIMQYPPFAYFFSIMISSKNEDEVIRCSNIIVSIMKYFNKKNEFLILGPTPAFISKVKNEYRYVIIVKYKYEDKLRNFVIYCIDKFKEKNNKSSVYINISMNNMIY